VFGVTVPTPEDSGRSPTFKLAWLFMVVFSVVLWHLACHDFFLSDCTCRLTCLFNCNKVTIEEKVRTELADVGRPAVLSDPKTWLNVILHPDRAVWK